MPGCWSRSDRSSRSTYWPGRRSRVVGSAPCACRSRKPVLHSSDITTRAVRDGDDALLGQRYRLFGNKMWISGGDHDIVENIVHLVLAKVPGEDGRIAPGMAGISLFACRNGCPIPTVRLASETTSWWRGSITRWVIAARRNCLLAFGEGTRNRPGGRPAPSASWSARSGRVSPSCSG